MPASLPNLDRYAFTIEELSEELKERKRKGLRSTLLIGAGCSVSGGVPLAGRLVEIIRNDFKAAYRRAEQVDNKEPEYARCMAALKPHERRELFADHIDKAKVNAGHVAIAGLMLGEYIHRILSVNFDDLLIRAYALQGRLPAIYDLSVAPTIVNYARLRQPAIFYLHGQITSYAIKNTTLETEAQARILAPCFDFSAGQDLWIVAGYSGANDAIFRHYIGSAEQFDSGLYWVAHGENDPVGEVQQALFTEEKYAHLLRPMDSDTFFMELGRKLGTFPPRFLSEPFTYLELLLNDLAEWKIDGDSSGPHIITQTRDTIRRAVEHYETTPPKQDTPAPSRRPVSSLEANAALVSGDYDKLLQLWEQADDVSKLSIADSVAWAPIMQGLALVDLAKQEPDEVASRKLCEQAILKYKLALGIKPAKDEALNNWGSCLTNLANREQDLDVARILYKKAFGKYKRTLDIKPDNHIALNNWGWCLSSLANRELDIAIARPMFEQAFEKLKQAIDVKPGYVLALNNWRWCLTSWANREEDIDTARPLYEQAFGIYKQILDIEPDDHDSLNGWANVLVALGRRESDAKIAKSLFAQASNRAKMAEKIRAGSGAYNIACAEARLGNAEECRRWLEVCIEQGTLQSKPHIESDPDLDSVRNLPWFAEILAKAK